VLGGTPRADTIYTLGGADLVRGYDGKDFLFGDNEAGRGDKIKGGTFSDRIFGQDGYDALYGEGATTSYAAATATTWWRAAPATTPSTAAPAPTR
jgi:Ca2+-binding RTX toxin-like protein